MGNALLHGFGWILERYPYNGEIEGILGVTLALVFFFFFLIIDGDDALDTREERSLGRSTEAMGHRMKSNCCGTMRSD